MSAFASFGRLTRALRAGGVCAALALIPSFAAEGAPAAHAVPDFMSPGSGWDMVNSNATNYVDPPSGARPITFDPRYPHVGNL